MTDILQRTEIIRTHLGVKVQEEHVNDWVPIAGTEEINLETSYSVPVGTAPLSDSQDYWGYRGGAAMCQYFQDHGVLLDGTTGYISFPDNYDFPTNTNYTVGIWFYATAWPAATAILIGKGNLVGANGGWCIALTSTGKVYTQRVDASSFDATAQTPQAVLNQWNLAIATYDGSTLSMYLNPTSTTANATVASTRTMPGNALNLMIGRSSNSSASFFGGYVYAAFTGFTAATGTNILGYYQDASINVGQAITYSRPGAITTLGSQWPLNEWVGSGTTAADISGTGSNGTYTGGFTLTPTSVGWFGLGSTNRIIRVRIGDGTTSDRQLYIQAIYNPILQPTQWTSWAVQYSGSHYAVDVQINSLNVLSIAHAKSDGLYLNNVQKVSLTGIVAVHFIQGRANSLYFTRVSTDSLDGRRVMETYIVNDITASFPITPTYDKLNYRYPHVEMAAFQWVAGDASLWHTRIRSLPHSAPSVRKVGVSDDLVQDYIQAANYIADVGNIGTLKSASGRAGTKFISGMWVSVQVFANSRTWLFYTERHVDPYNNSLSNLHSPAFYTTTGFTLDGWTEPQPLGFSLWAIAGAVVFGPNIIVAGNGLAAYKPTAGTEVDLSNYALSAQLSLPRGNEKATGDITLANPNDVVGQLLGMTSDTLSPAPQKRVKVIIGTLGSTDEAWQDVEVNDWWIAEAHRISEDNFKHIELRLGDFRQRMESDFRDAYSFPGRMEFLDWQPGAPNSFSNWYSLAATPSLQSLTTAEGESYYGLKTSQAGGVLMNNWKGAHLDFQLEFTLPAASPVRVYFRYVDSNNHWRLTYAISTVTLQQVVNGTVTNLQTLSVATNQTNFTMRVIARWGWIRYYFNASTNTYQETGTVRADQFGFVGYWVKVANAYIEFVNFKDFEQPQSTSSLIKWLLIYAGYTQFNISDDLRDIEQMAILWGPQTDVATPAKALEKLLEGNQQDVLWTPTSVNVRGQINIDQYESLDAEYDIDEEIISVDQAEISELRPNVVLVDGQEDSWTEYSRTDLPTRGAVIGKYFDLPELTTLTAVRAKAQEEKTLAAKGNSLGGLCIWRPWFQRMDSVTWYDHDDNVYLARIEGMDIDIAQGAAPSQHVQLDLSPISICDPEADTSGLGPGSGGSGTGGEVVDPTTDFVTNDDFHRDDAPSTWGSALTGGAYTLTGTAADFDIVLTRGRIATNAAGSIRLAHLNATSFSTPVYVLLQFQVMAWPDDWLTTGIAFRIIDTSNYYYATVRIDPTTGDARFHIYKRVAGVETLLFNSGVIIGLPIYLTSQVNLKIWVTGTSPTKIYAKVWKGTSAEPDTWQYSVQDSSSPMQAAGRVGVRYYNSTAVTVTGDVSYILFRTTNAPS